MVFGSVASASSWEPFRRAIAALAESYFGREDLVARHRVMLDSLDLSSPSIDASSPITLATRCSKNAGIFLADGTARKTPHFIYVDDDLMADTIPRLPLTIASVLHSVFTILGWPMPLLRPSPIAEDKWELLRIATRQTLLGLVFDTRAMTVSISPAYREETLQILRSTWHASRRSFTVRYIELLIGKLGRIGQAFRPMYHLMPHLYGSVAYALRENKFLLASTLSQFRAILKMSKARPSYSTDMRDINFAITQSSKLLHSARFTYAIPQSLREEIDYIRDLLTTD